MSTRTAYHPKCGNRFPSGDRYGHCATCCRTFVGEKAFDRHRRDGTCIMMPETYISSNLNTVTGHWQDSRGFWHFGDRMPKDLFR